MNLEYIPGPRKVSIDVGDITLIIQGNSVSDITLHQILPEVKSLLCAWGYQINGDLEVSGDETDDYVHDLVNKGDE